MGYLHRFAITVTRKQPYADWANRETETDVDPVPFRDDLPRTVYLVGPSTSGNEVEEFLDDFWEVIFEEELAAWSEDSATWPEPRTRELFDSWFGSELTDSVIDLTPEEPLSEDDLELTAVDEALHRCAWCDLELDSNTARRVGIGIANREPLASREGCVIVLTTRDNQPLAGILTTRDSPMAAAGDDLLFSACTSRCEKLIRKEAPRALRRLLDRLATS